MGDFQKRSVAAALAAAVAGGAVDIRTPISPIGLEARCVSVPRMPEEYMILPNAEKIQAIAARAGLTLEQAGEKFLHDDVASKMGWNSDGKKSRDNNEPAAVFITDQLKDVGYILYTQILPKSDLNRMEDLWVNLEGLSDDPAFVYFHNNRSNMIVMSRTAPPIVTPLREGIQKAAYPWASFNMAFQEHSLNLSDIEAARTKRNGYAIDRSDKYWAQGMADAADEFANGIIATQIRDKAYRYEDTPIIKIFGKREDAHRLMSTVDSLRDQFKKEYLTANPGTRRTLYPIEMTSCGRVPSPEVANVFWFGLPRELQEYKAVRENNYVSRGEGYVQLMHGGQTYSMLMDEVLKNPVRLTSMLRNIYFADNNLHYRLQKLSEAPKPK